MESKQRAAVIAILFAVVTLYFISQYYLTTKEDEVKTSQSIQLRSNFYYNNDFVVKSSLYESCSSLRSMLEHVEKEELHSAERTKHYQKLYDEKKIGCGKHRTAPGLISKSIIVGYDECPQEIVPAKRRLYDLMNELCKTQVEANAFCPPLTYGLSQVHVPPPVNRSHHSPLFGGFDADHKCLAKSNSVHKDRTSKLFRGILYTGKIKHFKDIYQSIYALRKTGNTLPVEVWVNGFGMYFCKNIFMNPKNNALSGVTCMEFSNDIISFAAKFYALLFTEFEEILYIDADNIPVRDVNELFESEGYQKTGAVIWPDMWSSKCAVDDTELQMSGLSCQENFVLFSAEFSKELQYVDTRNYLQESEAGQMVLNLQKHRGLINLGRRLYEDNQFFRKIFNGDKDIFRFIFLLTGTPFHYINEVPGYSVAPDDTRDCLIHFHHNARVSSSQKLPIFFHQLKARSAQAFAKFVRPLPEERDAPAVCVRVKEDGLPPELPLDHPLQKKYYKKGETSVILVEGEAHQPQGKAYLVETPPEAAALVTFAEDVFKVSDERWRSSPFWFAVNAGISIEIGLKYLNYIYFALVVLAVLCPLACFVACVGLSTRGGTNVGRSSNVGSSVDSSA